MFLEGVNKQALQMLRGFGLDGFSRMSLFRIWMKARASQVTAGLFQPPVEEEVAGLQLALPWCSARVSWARVIRLRVHRHFGLRFISGRSSCPGPLKLHPQHKEPQEAWQLAKVPWYTYAREMQQKLLRLSLLLSSLVFSCLLLSSLVFSCLLFG